MSDLRAEWLEKIKVVKRQNIQYKNYGLFTVMTDFYMAPDEIRNDREICLKVLLESEEFIWNIPDNVKTLEFYEELFQKGYKNNLLENKSMWEEESFDFLNRYLSSFKNNKPSFPRYLWNKGVFGNRDMVLELVRKGLFSNEKFLLEHHKKDKEIMFALLDNHPQSFTKMLKSIKNAYFKNEANIFKILESGVFKYEYFPEKFQRMESVIDFILLKDGSSLNLLPKDIIEDKEKFINFIKTFSNIKGTHIPYIYHKDYDVAKIMIERSGENFRNFDFKNNEELLRLSMETYNNVSYLPATEDYKELIKTVILRSNENENAINLSYSSGNGKKAEMFKDLFPQLLRDKKISTFKISQYFSERLKNFEFNDNAPTNAELNRELYLECVKIDSLIFEKTKTPLNKKDFEIIYIYMKKCESQNKNYKDYIDTDLKMQAKNMGISLESYINNEYLAEKLSKNLPESPKVKAKKI